MPKLNLVSNTSHKTPINTYNIKFKKNELLNPLDTLCNTINKYTQKIYITTTDEVLSLV